MLVINKFKGGYGYFDPTTCLYKTCSGKTDLSIKEIRSNRVKLLNFIQKRYCYCRFKYNKYESLMLLYDLIDYDKCLDIVFTKLEPDIHIFYNIMNVTIDNTREIIKTFLDHYTSYLLRSQMSYGVLCDITKCDTIKLKYFDKERKYRIKTFHGFFEDIIGSRSRFYKETFLQKAIEDRTRIMDHNNFLAERQVKDAVFNRLKEGDSVKRFKELFYQIYGDNYRNFIGFIDGPFVYKIDNDNYAFRMEVGLIRKGKDKEKTIELVKKYKDRIYQDIMEKIKSSPQYEKYNIDLKNIRCIRLVMRSDSVLDYTFEPINSIDAILQST